MFSEKALLEIVVEISPEFRSQMQAAKYRPVFWSGEKAETDLKEKLREAGKQFTQLRIKSAFPKGVYDIGADVEALSDEIYGEYYEWLKMTIGIACEMDLVDAIDELMHEPELTQTLCKKLNDIVRRAVLSFEPESDLDICTEMIEFEHH